MAVKTYTESMYYQIKLTARHLKLLGNQVFKQNNIEIFFDEFITLDVIAHSEESLCQRDLAKIILKDRANTGKMLNTLEQKGFITRHSAIKNNRSIKEIQITEKGNEFISSVLTKLEPVIKLLDTQMGKQEQEIIQCLIKCRKILSEIVTNEI